MIKKLLSNATVKNAGWIIGGRIAQMMINLAVSLLTARFLGPSNYGLINYVASYTAFFMAFCTLGINSVLVKEFIDNPDKEGRILGTILVMRGISSFLSAGVILCIVSIIDANEPVTIQVTALSCVGLVFHIFEVFRYWFQYRLMSKMTAIAATISYVITAIYKVVLLALGKNVEWFAFSTSLDYICVGLLLFLSYRKCGGQKLSFSLRTGRQILNKSVHYILPGLMVSIYNYTDKFMLKQMLSEAEVGYYSTATVVCGLWCFVLSAIIDSVYPSIVQAYKKGDLALFEKRNRQLYAIVFYLSILVSVFLCVFGEYIVLMLYGEEFSAAVSPLRIATWYTAFSYLGVARGAWIICEEKQKYLKYIYVSAAVGNIIMNLLLIPAFGAKGAAAASLITQILTTMIVPFFIGPLRRNSILMLESIILKGVR